MADIIEEVDSLITYLGFCAPGCTLETSPQWSILKIVQSDINYPIVTTSQWATGFCSYNLKWSDRAIYDYSFKKF